MVYLNGELASSTKGGVKEGFGIFLSYADCTDHPGHVLTVTLITARPATVTI